jgi:hypothetical protein
MVDVPLCVGKREIVDQIIAVSRDITKKKERATFTTIN